MPERIRQLYRLDNDGTVTDTDTVDSCSSRLHRRFVRRGQDLPGLRVRQLLLSPRLVRQFASLLRSGVPERLWNV